MTYSNSNDFSNTQYVFDMVCFASLRINYFLFSKDKSKCIWRDYTALCCHKTISQSFSYYHQRKLEWIVKFNCSQSSIGKRPSTSYLNYTICLQITTLYVSWISYYTIHRYVRILSIIFPTLWYSREVKIQKILNYKDLHVLLSIA